MGYAKDKNYKITIRINEKQYSYLQSSAAKRACSPSEYLRSLLDNAIMGERAVVRPALRRERRELRP